MTARDERLTRPADSGATTAAWWQDEHVTGVDADDNEVGLVSRTTAHGLDCSLHRAFMVLLVDENRRLLLCRRSEYKLLWPLHWADSCAGHPRPGEDVREAACRRLMEEVGCSAELSTLGTFVYRADYHDIGCEHELCHVFAGRVCGDLAPDPVEVSETTFLDPRHLELEMGERPQDFVPWLVACLRTFPASAFLAAAQV